MKQQVCYVGQSYVLTQNAGVKPTCDVQAAAAEVGARNIGLPTAFYKHWKAANLHTWASARFAEWRMPEGGTIILQFPEQAYMHRLVTRACEKHCKIIFFIHDIDSLRGMPDKREELLDQADVIIAHTPAMADVLRRRFSKAKISVLGIFDYRGEEELPPVSPDGSIAFAGNLSKAPFLKHISEIADLPRITLFGRGCPAEFNEGNSGIDYRGAVNPDELPAVIASCSFGLVWDGDRIDTCSGAYGLYLRYNAPFKASSYLAAALPLIVWKKMGIADFVEKEGIGIAVESLAEIPQRIAAMTADDYHAMRASAAGVREKIIKGHFAKTALSKAIEACK